MVTRSSHSINMCPPHSPTRITKKSILKLPGAFHWPKTSRIRFWAFSYSMAEPCGRSVHLITYFIVILPKGVTPSYDFCAVDPNTKAQLAAGTKWREHTQYKRGDRICQ